MGRNIVRRRRLRRNNAEHFYGQVVLHGHLVDTVDTVDRRCILLYSSSTEFVRDAGYRITGYVMQGRVVQDTGYRVLYRIQDQIPLGIQETGYRLQVTGLYYYP